MTEGTARDAILARARAALADRPVPIDVPRGYERGGSAGVDQVERFAERVASYRASVVRCAEPAIAAELGAAIAGIAGARVAVPAGIPTEWLVRLSSIVTDEPALSNTDLDAVDAVLTGCAVAIAETGTIVLDAGPGQGRRALTLLPDRHLCVVRLAQIVPDVATALERLDPRRPLTWISGPSATSDIELQRIEGVHGPRSLYVFIVDPVDAQAR